MTLANLSTPPLTSLPAPEELDLSHPAHLLIVDDELDIAESLADYLHKKEGYHITMAAHGQYAIDILAASVKTKPAIDLVILDLRMPEMSGLDVLNWIRQHETLRYTRVILLTAASGSHEKVEALSAGADDYVTKPYLPQELLARVKTILRTLALEKRLQRQSDQLSILNQLAQAVAGTLETAQVLTTAVSGMEALLDCELAAALILEGGKLRYKAVHRGSSALPTHKLPAIAVQESALGRVLTTQQPLLVQQEAAPSYLQPALDVPAPLPLTDMAAAPLIVRERAVGVLCAYNRRNGRFHGVDLDLVVALASSVSEAIENAWLFQRIRMRQQELLENRNTLQALIDGIPHPIYTINDHWELVTVNKSKADELDATPEALVGPHCYTAFFDRQTPCEHCLVAHTLANKDAQRWTVSWIGEDHLPQEWDVSAYPIPSRQANAARAVILWQDRTEERRLENSLLQAGKLAAIGQLAAGVAHEINNPLTVVNANAEMLKMVMDPEEDSFESVDLIARAGQQAANVVQGLLDFARQEQYTFSLGDINESVQQTLALVQYQLQQANIQVLLDLDYQLPRLVASWEHLKSVWLNLLVNARDALETRDTERQINISTRMDGSETQVQVLIQDNGKGMSKAEMSHIFEPFYTTKDPGKGTGLGLATCHRILEQHGGDINAMSSVGEGTTFIIRLPRDGSQSTRS